jgi:Holliday junction DNA helicase RuvA
MSVTELAQAVTLQEAGRLIKVPGIGKKTAERLLLELRDRLPKASAFSQKVGAGGTAVAMANDNLADILNALIALGYNDREALSAMKALTPETAVGDGIRQALKLLSKG